MLSNNLITIISFSAFAILIIILILLFRSIKKTKVKEVVESASNFGKRKLNEKYRELIQQMITTLSYNYKDLEFIAEGGMGIICKAYDIERERKVAIKTILPELTKDEEVVQLFLQECQVIQAMNHPNIVRIFEVGKSEYLYYYVMDFLDGENLEEIVDKQGLLPIEMVVKIGTQVARALQHIHSNGIVHRDIKPSNIFYTKEGISKILDFGIVKMLNQKESTYSYSSVGSPVYASPEQIRGETVVTGKSDIYSLGTCLFYLLTQDHPFNSSDLIAKMFDTPKDIKKLNPNVPDKLVKIVQLCINVDPKKRLPAHELWARLRAFRH